VNFDSVFGPVALGVELPEIYTNKVASILTVINPASCKLFVSSLKSIVVSEILN